MFSEGKVCPKYRCQPECVGSGDGFPLSRPRGTRGIFSPSAESFVRILRAVDALKRIENSQRPTPTIQRIRFQRPQTLISPESVVWGWLFRYSAGSMTAPALPTTPDNPEVHFISLSTLLAPGGLVAKTLSPAPSRRSLLRCFRAAGVQRFKCSGAFSPGRGEVYFDRSAVEAWIASNISDGVKQKEKAT